jgi:hypothetical protein
MHLRQHPHGLQLLPARELRRREAILTDSPINIIIVSLSIHTLMVNLNFNDGDSRFRLNWSIIVLKK